MDDGRVESRTSRRVIAREIACSYPVTSMYVYEILEFLHDDIKATRLYLEAVSACGYDLRDILRQMMTQTCTACPFQGTTEEVMRHYKEVHSRKTVEEVPFEPPTSIKERQEQVDHPRHYGGADNPYEAIKVIEAWGLGFNLGNAVKYIARAGKKGDRLEDLKKAMWYLQREIDNGGRDDISSS